MTPVHVGTHWPTPGHRYRPHTPTVELAYLEVPEGDLHHPSQTMRRVEQYAAAHPEARVVLRIDWATNAQSYPPTSSWDNRLQQFRWLDHLGDRLVLQCGNEPQLEGVEHYDDVLDAFWVFRAEMQAHLPNALIGSIPIATFHPNRLGAPVGCSPEGSPWADLDFAFHDRLWHDQGPPPDIDLLHVYGDGRNPVAVDCESRSSQGWRWGINIAETWQENREALGIDTRVMITEFNTSARGTNAPHRPVDNYRDGWLTEACAYVERTIPACADICWFVGSVDGRGESWSSFAVDRIARLRSDFEALA